MLNRNEFLAAVARKGITNGELAKRVGMGKNTLSAKINGKSYFDTKQIEDICRELEITDDGEKIKIFLCNSSHNRDGSIKRKEVIGMVREIGIDVKLETASGSRQS